jgi:phenylalanyl-tRNA synthetase beta subunit
VSRREFKGQFEDLARRAGLDVAMAEVAEDFRRLDRERDWPRPLWRLVPPEDRERVAHERDAAAERCREESLEGARA